MADEPKIFSLHYKGSRFRNARLPVDVLSDLPAFRDLLVSYAKDEWHQRHADRKRVPKGFDKSLAFDLVKIEDGSAIPKLEWNRTSAQVNLPGFADEIEEVIEAAYDDVVNLIAGKNRGTGPLSLDKIRALNRFGAGLRDNEKIELIGRISGNVVSLDASRRKQLITGARETYLIRYEATGELIGTVIPSELEAHIIVRTSEYGDIKIPVDRVQIYEEFSHQLNNSVQFEILVELDSQDKFRSTSEVFEVGVVFDEITPGQEKALARLAELRNLPQGWHEGVGKRISEDALRRAEELFSARPLFCDIYRIFPNESGGILIDFELKNWDLSVEFSPTGTMEMYGIETNGDQEMDPHEFKDAQELLEEVDQRVNKNG